MSYQFRAQFDCPYCGTTAHYLVNPADGPRVIVCDSDEGGCDRQFVVTVTVRVATTVRRIEGEIARGAA